MGTSGRTDGVAGASARREHERRRAGRERRARERHGRLAGLLLALAGAPQHERRWAHGAGGEERVAAVLEQRCRPEVALLHDRAVPRSRANVDHLAVAPSGVWVVDAKRYTGAVRVRRPLLGRASLRVGGRDRTSLVDGVLRQVDLVTPVVEAYVPGTPVHGALCFVDGDLPLPLLGRPAVDGVAVLGPRALARQLNADGPLRPDHVTALTGVLAARFAPA
jgi:hypothetical protein